MPPARHDVYSQLAVSLRHLQIEAVEPTPIPPIHPLAEPAVVGVAVVVGVVGGVGVTGGFLVGAGHSSFLPFDILILSEKCYEIKYIFVTILLQFWRAGLKSAKPLAHPSKGLYHIYGATRQPTLW